MTGHRHSQKLRYTSWLVRAHRFSGHSCMRSPCRPGPASESPLADSPINRGSSQFPPVKISGTGAAPRVHTRGPASRSWQIGSIIGNRDPPRFPDTIPGTSMKPAPSESERPCGLRTTEGAEPPIPIPVPIPDLWGWGSPGRPIPDLPGIGGPSPPPSPIHRRSGIIPVPTGIPDSDLPESRGDQAEYHCVLQRGRLLRQIA